ncbi:hypothetical protein Q2T42_30910 [Leptolyngbya boryana CZ1]|uniref:Uncharacterized protein n=1 Tax=Leptolyngbya boryana CZ1 TaxID=3060204 RepID=A0AA96WW69_LEPBY|nr:hypothetical protein [Leptolyngbya boryana]WNZ46203.1 hypothetical protein Q2T42_30910 [Leptolyngbya boryana CZ1]
MTAPPPVMPVCANSAPTLEKLIKPLSKKIPRERPVPAKLFW